MQQLKNITILVISGLIIILLVILHKYSKQHSYFQNNNNNPYTLYEPEITWEGSFFGEDNTINIYNILKILPSLETSTSVGFNNDEVRRHFPNVFSTIDGEEKVDAHKFIPYLYLILKRLSLNYEAIVAENAAIKADVYKIQRECCQDNPLNS